MTSRTSFFNRAIFLRELRRTAPLWIMYLLLILLLPFGILSSYDPARSFEPIGNIISYTNAFSSVIAFLYGAVLAWILHASLFRATPTNYYAALPIRRETLFVTRYLTGFAAAAVPNLLAAVLTYFVTSALGNPKPEVCLVFFGASTLGFLFFYGLATVCCMVSAQVIMMPILYIILNFVAVVVEIILVILMESFVYGMPQIYSRVMEPFSPLYQMLFRDFGGYSDIRGFHFEDMGYLAVLGAVGIAFSVLAFILFRQREMERSGDVIAVRWIRPVFQYAFTLGCALVFCQVVKSFVASSDFSHSFATVMVLLLLGAVIGHFVVRMLLNKSLRVFQGGWKSLGICCVILILGFGAMRLDLFGYCTYIPDVSQIRAVSLQSYNLNGLSYPVTDLASVEQVTTMHQHFLDERAYLSELDSNYTPFYLAYELENGKTVVRKYRLPLNEQQTQSALTDEFCAIYDSLPFVLAREVPADVTAENITSCTIEYQNYREDKTEKFYEEDTSVAEGAAVSVVDGYSSYTLGSAEAQTLFADCVLPDFADSSLGRNETYPLWDNTHSFSSFSITLDFQCRVGDGSRSFYISLSDDAARTIAYLQELGYIVSE